MSYILGDPEFTTNIYCKSRNLPNTDMQITVQICGNFAGHPVLQPYWHTRILLTLTLNSRG